MLRGLEKMLNPVSSTKMLTLKNYTNRFYCDNQGLLLHLTFTLSIFRSAGTSYSFFLINCLSKARAMELVLRTVPSPDIIARILTMVYAGLSSTSCINLATTASVTTTTCRTPPRTKPIPSAPRTMMPRAVPTFIPRCLTNSTKSRPASCAAIKR